MAISKISCDCDGVLRDLIFGLVFTYQKHYPNHKIILPIPSSAPLQNFFPIKENIVDFFCEHAEEVFYTNSPMIKDADRGMKYLRRLGYELIITTSQKEETINPTVRWLKKFKIKVDKVYCTKDKHLVDFDIHIDDDPVQVANILNAGKRAILFSPIGNEVVPELENKCVRVHDWNEIIDLFEDYSKVESHVKSFISFPSK